MSIGIALAVPDGIALAADSQTTWTQTITRAKEKGSGKEIELAQPIAVPIGWARMAKKLFSIQIAGQHFGIVTAGAARLNGKTTYAVFQSAARAYDGEENCASVAKYLVEFVRRELAEQFDCSVGELKDKQRVVCEFMIAGYEDQDVARPFIESHLAFSGTLTYDGKELDSGSVCRWANHQQDVRYHAAWIGKTAYIAHVVNHKNPELPQISGQFAMMTLADAVEYTRFLVRFTCDFQRFAVGVPNCALPLVSATLTPEGYEQEVVL